MKKLSFFLVFFAFITLLYSCGGVIGNIHRYKFPGTSDTTIKVAVDNVFKKHPEFIKKDTSKYKPFDENYRFCIIDHHGEKYVLRLYLVPSSVASIAEITLSSGTKWGKTMELAPNIGYFEKRKYRKMFGKYFLPKLYEELKK